MSNTPCVPHPLPRQRRTADIGAPRHSSGGRARGGASVASATPSRRPPTLTLVFKRRAQTKYPPRLEDRLDCRVFHMCDITNLSKHCLLITSSKKKLYSAKIKVNLNKK